MSAVTLIAAFAAFAAAAAFGLLGPVLATRLPPRHATWLLSVGAALASLSCLTVLSLFGFVLVGQFPAIAEAGHWSPTVLRENALVKPGVEAASVIAVLAAGASVVTSGARRGLALLAAHRTCKGLATPSELVVLDDAPAAAVAVPGRPGRIVVARCVLTALGRDERRALLAHERAHLDHGHHWHSSAVSLAVAANPLLTPLRAAIGRAVERWADEVAAQRVGDRRVVATALARAALAAPHSPRTEPLLAAAEIGVSARIAALLLPPQRPRPGLLWVAGALLFAGVLAGVVAEKETEHLFEFAGRTYQATHGQ